MKHSNEIILFEGQNIKLDVIIENETVWLTQSQMAELFLTSRTNVVEHINHIYTEEELEQSLTCRKFRQVQKEGNRTVNREISFYNLDMIISVGYRVKSKNGIIFRKWANQVLKDYILKGYAINNKRLEYLEKTVKIIEIANRIGESLSNDESRDILKVIGTYSKALDLLDDYDRKSFKKLIGTENNYKITYENCLNLINQLKFKQASKLFALERETGLKGIIGNIYQSYDSKELYNSDRIKSS